MYILCYSVAEKVIGRKFEITEYGICFIEDILDDIPDSVIKVRTNCVNAVHTTR